VSVYIYIYTVVGSQCADIYCYIFQMVSIMYVVKVLHRPAGRGRVLEGLTPSMHFGSRRQFCDIFRLRKVKKAIMFKDSNLSSSRTLRPYIYISIKFNNFEGRKLK
jgi:hypothetical protein